MQITASNCRRCATVVLAGSTVCTSCCAPIAGGTTAPIYIAAPVQPKVFQPAYVATRGWSNVPAQRDETHSVPSVGPNPFLAAARIQHARERVAAL